MWLITLKKITRKPSCICPRSTCSTLRWHLLAPERYDGIHWFDARQSLPLPMPGEEAVYILLAENQPQPWLLMQAPGLQHVDIGIDRFDRPVFEVYRWVGDDYPQPNNNLPVAWSWATSFEPGDSQGSAQSYRIAG